MKMEFEFIKDNLKLKYPCSWTYKIIGMNAGNIRQAISDTITDRDYKINFSNFSANGKYISLNLEVVVDDEAQRTEIFDGPEKTSGYQNGALIFLTDDETIFR